MVNDNSLHHTKNNPKVEAPAIVIAIDHIEGHLFALDEALNERDYMFIMTTSGKEVLEILEKKEVAVILVNAQMPELEGYALAKKIKALPKNNETPIIFVSADVTPQSTLKAYQSGAVDFIPKPIEKVIIKKKVETFVSLYREKKRRIEAEAITAQSALKASQEQTKDLIREQEFLKALLENLSDGIVACDADGKLVAFNRATREFHGLPEKPISPEQWADFYSLYESDGVTPLKTERIPLFRALNEGKVENAEMVIALKNKPARALVANGQSILKSDGSKLGAVVIMRDITEIRQADEVRTRLQSEAKAHKAIENERENFRNLFKQTPEMVCILKGADHVFEFVNASYIKILGFDATGKSVREAQPESVEMYGILDDVCRTGKTAELHEIPVTVGDRLRYFNLTFAARRDESGKIDGVMILGAEVTEQITARNIAKNQENELRNLANSIPQLSWMAEPDGNIFWYNNRWYEYTGTTIETMQGWGWQSVHDPDILPKVIEGWTYSISNGVPFEMTFPLRSKSGEFRSHLTRVNPVKDANGNILRWFGTNTDIEDAISAQREIIDTIESMSDAFFAIDKDWKITRVNAHQEKVTGIQRDDQIGKDVRQLFFSEPDQKNSVYIKSYTKAMSERVFVKFEAYYEPLTLWTEVRVYPKSDGGLAVFFTDITERKATEKQLEQTAERLTFESHNLVSLLEASPSPNVLWRTKDLIYERVSPSYQALFPQKVLIGKPIREALPEKEYENFFPILKDVFDTGHSVTMKEQVVPLDIDGTGMKDRYYTISFFQIKDAHGQPYGVYQHAVDNTEQVLAREVIKASRDDAELARKDAENSKRNLQLALERGHMGIWQIDLKANSVSFSPEAMALFLIDAHEINVPELINSMMHPDDVVEINRVLLGAISESKPYAHDYRIIRKDGKVRWLSAKGDAVLDDNGHAIYYSGTVQDVTEQVLARNELEKAKLEAELANQTKSSFLANMSHEIRTPLGAILGFSTLLKDSNIDSVEKDRYLDTIVRNGTALTTIIDDILDLAKVEAGRLDIENIPFSLYTLVSDVVDVFKDKTREKNIYLLLNIDEAVPSQICTDPTRLRQILVNLIGNAVKFTEKGGVRVNIHSAPAGENKIKIIVDVKDTGIGLTEEQKNKLFIPFTQADNSMTRKFGGTGLGLALSQRLSHALSGEISIPNCKPGEGCTFAFTFVADLNKNKNVNKRSDRNSANDSVISLDGMRVLVVDDSPDNQFLVEQLLVKNGATVDTAQDGDEGVKKALSGSFDVVLMDIQMPKLDGYQAKAELDKSGYEKPVIALTAHAMSDERIKTQAAGFAGHLTKPLNRTELLKTLATFIKS
ncbi:MAG: PAS domain-containing protein [Bdellovibrionaceae bacterium]|nr:PAS domain-containing protein [Pseudobdellovibrionaceae bacterium]